MKIKANLIIIVIGLMVLPLLSSGETLGSSDRLLTNQEQLVAYLNSYYAGYIPQEKMEEFRKKVMEVYELELWLEEAQVDGMTREDEINVEAVKDLKRNFLLARSLYKSAHVLANISPESDQYLPVPQAPRRLNALKTAAIQHYDSCLAANFEDPLFLHEFHKRFAECLPSIVCLTGKGLEKDSYADIKILFGEVKTLKIELPRLTDSVELDQKYNKCLKAEKAEREEKRIRQAIVEDPYFKQILYNDQEALKEAAQETIARAYIPCMRVNPRMDLAYCQDLVENMKYGSLLLALMPVLDMTESAYDFYADKRYDDPLKYYTSVFEEYEGEALYIPSVVWTMEYPESEDSIPRMKERIPLDELGAMKYVANKMNSMSSHTVISRQVRSFLDRFLSLKRDYPLFTEKRLNIIISTRVRAEHCFEREMNKTAGYDQFFETLLLAPDRCILQAFKSSLTAWLEGQLLALTSDQRGGEKYVKEEMQEIESLLSEKLSAEKLDSYSDIIGALDDLDSNIGHRLRQFDTVFKEARPDIQAELFVKDLKDFIQLRKTRALEAMDIVFNRDEKETLVSQIQLFTQSSELEDLKDGGQALQAKLAALERASDRGQIKQQLHDLLLKTNNFLWQSAIIGLRATNSPVTINQQAASWLSEENRNCFEGQSDDNLLVQFRVCVNRLHGKLSSLLYKNWMEVGVSRLYALETANANNILSPLKKLDEGIQLLELGQELTDYQNKVEALLVLTEFHIAYLFSQELIKTHRPVITRTYRGRYPDFYLNYLKETSFKHSGEDILSQDLRQIILGNSGQDILQDYPSWAQAAKKAMVWREQIKKMVMMQFQYFLFENFCSSLLERPCCKEDDVFQRDRNVRELLSLTFDLETLDLISQIKMLQNRNMVQNDQGLLPEATDLSVVSMTILAKTIKIVSEYIDTGFYFDKRKAEVYVSSFRKPLKTILRGVLSDCQEGRPVDLTKLYMDIKEQLLVKFLLAAVVAQNVRYQFQTFLEQMKREDWKQFNHESRQRYQSRRDWWGDNAELEDEKDVRQRKYIKEKYEKLDKVMREMTSSFDFSRITDWMTTNPQKEHIEAREFLLEQYLLPLVLGQAHTYRFGDPTIQEKIGILIMADSTAEGFVGRIVEQVAQHHLNLFRDTRWIIIDDNSCFIKKWFWYTESDCLWTSLKETKAGRDALDYYNTHILVKRILGQQMSEQYLTEKMSVFKEKVMKAMEQN